MPKRKPSIKTCHMCQNTMASEHFVKNQWICKACRPEHRKQASIRLKLIGPRKSVSEKLCPSCGSRKQIKEFYKDSSTADGFSSHCGLCKRKYQVSRYEKSAREIKHKAKLSKVKNFTPEICDFTVEEWESLLDAHKGRCAYCNKQEKLVEEHIVPLRRGGDHTLTNILPACVSCNSKKKSRTALEFFLWQMELAS